MRKSPQSKQIHITPKLLHSWALPFPGEDGDKEDRGAVLIVAGAEGMPGAAILPATAALRAGAGKLQIAAPECIAPWVALAVPESFVLSLSQTKSSAPSLKAIKQISSHIERACGILIGAGMRADPALSKFVEGVISHVQTSSTVVLDAGALCAFRKAPRFLSKCEGRIIITPHAGEMAEVLGIDKEEVKSKPADIARAFSLEKGVVTVLKGDRTYISDIDGTLYYNDAGNVGLATSGSGDTLSGIIAGLAARGAEPVQAAAWGVYLHAAAGDVLKKRIGAVGYLAREVLDEIPLIMNKLTK